MVLRLEELSTPADAGAAVSDATEIRTAIEMGVDVTLLVANLRRTPLERIQRHDEQARFRSSVQSRTTAPGVRAKLAMLRLEEKVLALGLTLDEVLKPSDAQ